MKNYLWASLFLLSGCGGGSSESSSSWYQPGVNTTWQWQLSGTLNTEYAVDMYDIDLFDTSASDIKALQNEGKWVICYFSAGSYESWRDDADDFPSGVLGNTLDGWEDERWLDISAASVRSIMEQRLLLAKQKGCDGVEPDNVDGYSNDTGFNLTNSEQLNYNRWLARRAHAHGLAVGLKNDLDQISELVDSFDFAVNEQCFEYDECDALTPFIEAGKPVFNAEYADVYVSDSSARQTLCSTANAMSIQTLVLPLALDDSFRYACF